MKNSSLLVITNNFPNADNTYTGDIFVKEQLKALMDRFDAIYVICPISIGMERLRKTTYRPYEFNNVHVYFPKYVNNPAFYYYGRKYWIYFAKKAIRTCIRNEKIDFDLIHAHFTWPSGAVGVQLSEEYDVPLVLTEHSSISFQNAIRNRDLLWINTWKKADLIIRVRKGDIPLFQEVGVPLSKIRYIPNGFDGNLFFPMDPEKCRDVLGLPKNRRIILNVGNMYSKIKGHHTLIEAMKGIREERDDVLCVLVGKGRLMASLQKLIRSKGLQDSILLAGGRPHPELPLWMNASDLFVLPSLSEGNPTVMFENMGCGRPFLGTKVGGIPEVITSEKYGLLIDADDPSALRRGILHSLEKDWKRDIILQYSRQFTWQALSMELCSVYQTLLVQKGPISSL